MIFTTLEMYQKSTTNLKQIVENIMMMIIQNQL